MTILKSFESAPRPIGCTRTAGTISRTWRSATSAQEPALVFPDADPALRFYATNRIDMIEGWSGDTGHRARLLPLVRSKVEAIVEREGCFRVPKSFGYFVADV
jgi:hypothetical protein